MLAAAGFEWYEVSNWARPGEECRHNELYWTEGEYLGIGCAAHGHTDGRRWWNVRTPERYIAAVAEGAVAEAGSETSTAGRRAEEAVRARAAHPCWRRSPTRLRVGRSELAAAGLLERSGSRVVLTRRGRLLASDVTARLLLAGAAAVEGLGAGGRTDGVGTRYH